MFVRNESSKMIGGLKDRMDAWSSESIRNQRAEFEKVEKKVEKKEEKKVKKKVEKKVEKKI